MPSKRQSSKASPAGLHLNAVETAFLAAAVEDGIRIQPRFRPEPVLARTGRGYMKSTGVADIAQVRRKASAPRR